MMGDDTWAWSSRGNISAKLQDLTSSQFYTNDGTCTLTRIKCFQFQIDVKSYPMLESKWFCLPCLCVQMLPRSTL